MEIELKREPKTNMETETEGRGKGGRGRAKVEHGDRDGCRGGGSELDLHEVQRLIIKMLSSASAGHVPSGVE